MERLGQVMSQNDDLINGDHFFDIADFLTKHPFYAHFQGHTRPRATPASPLKTDFDGFIGIHTNQFDVSAVILQHRPDGFYHVGYL
jgi:hypothetical protein